MDKVDQARANLQQLRELQAHPAYQWLANNIQSRMDILVKNIVLQPVTSLETFFTREQAIGETRSLLYSGEAVINEIAKLEQQLEEHERPDAAARHNDAVDSDDA